MYCQDSVLVLRIPSRFAVDLGLVYLEASFCLCAFIILGIGGWVLTCLHDRNQKTINFHQLNEVTPFVHFCL